MYGLCFFECRILSYCRTNWWRRDQFCLNINKQEFLSSVLDCKVQACRIEFHSVRVFNFLECSLNIVSSIDLFVFSGVAQFDQVNITEMEKITAIENI